jgi:hypothetical protein
MRILLLVPIILLVTGCVSERLIVTGKASNPISPDLVTVSFTDKPSCDYEEVGIIQTLADFDMKNEIGYVKKYASKAGANYVLITNTGSGTYGIGIVLTGTAYRCK